MLGREELEESPRRRDEKVWTVLKKTTDILRRRSRPAQKKLWEHGKGVGWSPLLTLPLWV